MSSLLSLHLEDPVKTSKPLEPPHPSFILPRRGNVAITFTIYPEQWLRSTDDPRQWSWFYKDGRFNVMGFFAHQVFNIPTFRLGVRSSELLLLFYGHELPHMIDHDPHTRTFWDSELSSEILTTNDADINDDDKLFLLRILFSAIGVNIHYGQTSA